MKMDAETLKQSRQRKLRLKSAIIKSVEPEPIVIYNKTVHRKHSTATVK